MPQLLCHVSPLQTLCAKLAAGLHSDRAPCRELMIAALRRAFADAAGGGRAGTLKDIMTAQYARLAQALEDVIARLIQDTEVLLQAALLLLCVLAGIACCVIGAVHYGVRTACGC